jgi:hypothetical protein
VVEQSRTRRALPLAVDSLVVLGLFLAVTSWFTTWLLRPKPALILAAACVLAVIIGRRRAILNWQLSLSTVMVCGLGVALRAPALVEPAGFVGADGSLQAILTNVILNGAHPAPVFLETSSYQGSLKAHLGALASLFVGRDDLALLVVIASVLLWTIFVAAAISLGRRMGGAVPGLVAGLFAALSPRFATIFSVSNVGEYPDVLGLGTWAMAWAAMLLAEDRRGFEARAGYFAIGALIGVALWQQPIAISFGAASLGLLGLRALRRPDPWFLVAFLGLALGRLPVTLHDLQSASSNTAVVSSFARAAGQSLTVGEHARGTLEWAFPIVFAGLSNDAIWEESTRLVVGLFCSVIVLVFIFRAVVEFRTAFKARSWDMARTMAAISFVATLALIWLVAGGGQYQRPRYFLPLLAGFALALGDVTGLLWRRSRLLGLALAVFVIGSNAASNEERLKSGIEEGRALRALSERLARLNLRTGYAGVAVAGPLIMVSGERLSVDGTLDSAVGQRLPARHVDRVRNEGPDFYLSDPASADRITRRLDALGVTYKVEGEKWRLFHSLSRRVPLSEVQE